jgi:hypothetical protein
MGLDGACCVWEEEILLVEVQVPTYVVAVVVAAAAVAVLLGVSAMFVVFVAVFDYAVVLQSAVVGEVAQGVGEFPSHCVYVLHHMNHVETLVSSVKL